MTFFSRKTFRMIWKIEGGGDISYLAGFSHLFPYSFKKSLQAHMKNVKTVIFQGPLTRDLLNDLVDERYASLERTILYDCLDRSTICDISTALAFPHNDICGFPSYISMITPQRSDLLYMMIRGLPPWMSCLVVWLHFLERRGWSYSVVGEASQIATERGLAIHFAQTLVEQVSAHQCIPLESIVQFMRNIDSWEDYAEWFTSSYLKADLDSLRKVEKELPLSCLNTIDGHDDILYSRLRRFLEDGNVIFFAGTPHIPGIRDRLLKDGFAVV